MKNDNGKLLKSFGLGMAIVLVISNIIGSGVFKKVAPMSADLLSPNLVLLAWILAGIVTLFGVLTVAEAGTMFPHSGGAFSWLEKMYGKTISFFYGWSCFTVIQTAAIASIAFVFAGALGGFVNLPGLSDGSEKIKSNKVFVVNDSLFAEVDCGHQVFITNSKDTISKLTLNNVFIGAESRAPEISQPDSSWYQNDSLFMRVQTPNYTVVDTSGFVKLSDGSTAPTIISVQHSPHGIASTTILWGEIKPFDNLGAKVIAALLIIILTIVNVRGAKHGGRVSQIFTWIIVFCILIIICVGLSWAGGSFNNISTNSVDYPSPKFNEMWGLGIVMVMVIAMRNAFWGYEGWISLGYVGGEIKDPGKNVPRALILGILVVIVAYVSLNLTYLYVMPIDELLSEVNKNQNSIAAVIVMQKIFGEWGGYIISGMILISTFGCTNTTILTASRIYYAMAKKGWFFEKAARVHPKNNTPSKSLIYQCIWACILVFSGSFDLLTDLLIFAAFIFYGMVVFGVIVLRKKMKDAPRPYKTIGYPVVPILFVIFCILLVVISFNENVVKSLIGVGLILSGLPFYLMWRKRAGKITTTEED